MPTSIHPKTEPAASPVQRLVILQVILGAAGSWIARFAGFSALWFLPLRIAICAVAGAAAASRGRSAALAGLIVAGVDGALGVLTLGYGATLEIDRLFIRHRIAAIVATCAIGAIAGMLGAWLRRIGSVGSR